MCMYMDGLERQREALERTGRRGATRIDEGATAAREGRGQAQLASGAQTCTRSLPSSVTKSLPLATQTPDGKWNRPKVALRPPPRQRIALTVPLLAWETSNI